MEQSVNFRQRLRDLETEVKCAIEELVSEHKEIKIPYEYEELNDDVQQLIDDGFIVEEGDAGNNFIMELGNLFGDPLEVAIVGAKSVKNGTYIISDLQETYALNDVGDLRHLINLYEVLECTIKGDMSWKM